MTELLPCPFCGSDNIMIHEPPSYAVCLLCRAEGPIGGTEEDAKTAWNKRAASLPWKPIETAPKDRFLLVQLSQTKSPSMGWFSSETGKWEFDRKSLMPFATPTHWLDVMP